MELAILVYGVSLLEGLKGFLVLLGLLFGAIVIIAAICNIEMPDVDTDTAPAKRWLKRGVISLVLVCFTSVFIPSERTAYIMVAAYATQKIAQAPESRETGEKILTLINSKLDQIILEVQSTKKNK